MLYGVYPIASCGLHESIINEWWIINPLSFPPWLPCRNCGSLVLAASGDVQGRLADEGILRPALRKKGIHKLIASWSSFIAHRTTDNAVSVSLATLGRFCRSDHLYPGRLSYRNCTRSASRKTRPFNGLHNRQWSGIVVFSDCLQLKSNLCSIVSSGIKKRA